MRKKRQTKSHKSTGQQKTLTFMDHVRELQGRLVVVALAFLLAAAAAYPFFDKILSLIIAPLGPDKQLVYLTPGGAFSFIIQVCIYSGIVGALPVLIFHTYRFLIPAVKAVTMRRAIFLTLCSLFLAIAGIIFAYVIILPAALYFLTNFDLNHINPMLTVDSYFSFVMTYILAGALLFQLPLVMVIINTIKPLTPKKLMKAQGHIILGSFIVAAIISPTPDALNQTLLASPVIVMYQLSIMVIWAINHRKRKKQTAPAEEKSAIIGQASAQVVESPKPKVKAPTVPAVQPTVRYRKSIDGIIEKPTKPINSRSHISRNLVVPSRPATNRSITRSMARARTIDGFIISRAA